VGQNLSLAPKFLPLGTVVTCKPVRQAAGEGLACMPRYPVNFCGRHAPGPLGLPAMGLRQLELPAMEQPLGAPPVFEDHLALMYDLQLLAFQSDLTRVITFMMQREGSNRAFPEIGVPEGCHIPTHHMNDPAKIATARVIDEYRVKNFKYLVNRLNETQDGDGTLLDHTLLVYGGCIRDGNNHSHEDLPTVLLGGKAAGVKGGRHIRYKADTPMSNLWVTMLDKAGVPVDKLGDSTGQLDQLAGV